MQENKNEKTRIRGSNFSKEEELNLVKVIGKYKHIIENKNSDQIPSTQKEQAWEMVMKEFNSCNNHRTLSQIKSKYDNLKTAAKKYSATHNRTMYSTGGGPPLPPDSKSLIYDEIINIINKKTVVGLSNQHDDDNIANQVSYDILDSENANKFEIIVCKGEDSGEKQDQENVGVNESWTTYTPKMLKTQKNKKLTSQLGLKKVSSQDKTFYSLKQQYIEQKIQNLKNEEKRKQERHEKEIELLDIEIRKKRRLEYH